MRGIIAAEWRKARKRTALWIVLGLLLVSLILFGYVFTYVFLAGGDGQIPGFEGMDLLADMLPAAAVAQAVSGMAGFGGAFAVILGALLVGSEYGWATVKTMATQGPGRISLIGAKFVVLALIAIGTGVAYVLTALGTSAVIGALEGDAGGWPSVLDLLGGIGAASLIFGVWMFLGALLATLLRGVGLALGLGLVWSLVVEQAAVALPLPERVSDALAASLITPNGLALSSAFGRLEAAGFGPEPGDPTTAAIVLSLYAVVAVALTITVFTRREIA